MNKTVGVPYLVCSRHTRFDERVYQADKVEFPLACHVTWIPKYERSSCDWLRHQLINPPFGSH